MHFQWDFQGPPNNGTPFMVSGTHTIPISLGIRTWEWYGNATEVYQDFIRVKNIFMIFYQNSSYSFLPFEYLLRLGLEGVPIHRSSRISRILDRLWNLCVSHFFSKGSFLTNSP